MKYASYIISTLLLLVIIWQTGCSAKHLSNSYGDTKEYRDEDSVENHQIKEKKTKMPFDTSRMQILEFKS